jgi:starch synthase
VKILFLAAEADPFVKIGGLGDVAGSLPFALRRLAATPDQNSSTQVDIRLVIPFHGAIQRKSFPLRPLKSFDILSVNGPLRVEVLTTKLYDLPAYLISGDPIPPDSPVYTADTAINGYRLAFFSVAALELARSLDWVPDVIHANDWHTAPAVYALALWRDHDPFFAHTTSVLGLHNLVYLGAGPALASYGLPPAVGSELPWWAQDIPLPLGPLSADHIVAASPSYARVILTPEYGSGLHEFLKSRAQSISGILNGINPDQWDPVHDPALIANYTPDCPEYRIKNKETLQNEFGLEPLCQAIPGGVQFSPGCTTGKIPLTSLAREYCFYRNRS